MSFPGPLFTKCISLFTSFTCPSSWTRTWGGKYFEKISANLTAFNSSLVLRGELADVADAREAFDEDRVVQLRMVRISDRDVVHGVSPLQFMDPLKFAPVRPIAVLGRIPRRHRAPRRTTAVRADILQGVTAARGALLEDRAHRLSPSGGISLRRLSRSRL